MNPTDSNRPLRVLDKVLGGGLKAGDLGVVVARHGVGKVGVITCITIDHAMSGRNTLHIAVGEPVSDLRAYDDQVFDRICEVFRVKNRDRLRTLMERHKQIYAFRDGHFSVERLRATLSFLREHAEFSPKLIEIQGWPAFREVEPEEIQALVQAAQDFDTRIWLMAHRYRDDETDASGVPLQVARFLDQISVLMILEPEAEHVPIRFVKVHAAPLPTGIKLEYDPRTMLIRWR